MKTVGRWIWIMIAVIMIGAMLCACGGSKSNKSEQEKKVEMSIVVLEPAVDSYVDIEAEKYNEVKATLEARLNGAGIESYSVDADASKGRVKLRFPKEQENKITEGLLTGQGMMDLMDPDGAVRMNGYDVVSAQGIVTALEDGGTEYAVELRFDEYGASDRFADVTRELTGKTLSLYLDDELIAEKKISAPITDGKIQITVGGTADDLDRLVNMINAGPMPFPMRIAEFGTE